MSACEPVYFTDEERLRIARILSAVYEIRGVDDDLFDDFIDALENGCDICRD